MIVTVEDIIKLMEENINDDTAIVENYTKVVGIIDKINEQQAKTIFDQVVHNHEVAAAWARGFQSKSNLFQKQARQGSINPLQASQLERMQKQAEELAEARSSLEVQIGKAFLEKGFIDQKTYDKYY